MSKSRGNINSVGGSGKAAGHGAVHKTRSEAARDRCRDSQGRFEKCGAKMEKNDQGSFNDCGCAGNMDGKDKKADRW